MSVSCVKNTSQKTQRDNNFAPTATKLLQVKTSEEASATRTIEPTLGLTTAIRHRSNALRVGQPSLFGRSGWIRKCVKFGFGIRSFSEISEPARGA